MRKYGSTCCIHEAEEGGRGKKLDMCGGILFREGSVKNNQKL
jgi:hypothetical protein